jgi:hypothetical protein
VEEGLLIQSFFELFDGYDKAYTSVSGFSKKENGKVESKVLTRKGFLSKDEKENHLFGNRQSLGVIPLKSDNTLSFAVIDIDIINNVTPLRHSIEELEQQILKFSLPLIPCRSKSGGVHLYAFLKKDTEASLVIPKMKEWAALLGYAGAEIFPKQVKRANDGDIGNSINLPYFDSKNTERWAILQGQKLSLEQFIELANSMKMSIKDMNEVNTEENLNEEYDEAPPCLAMLLTKGIDEGSRNGGLLNIAVFLKKKYPDSFETKIMEVNGTLIKPSLALKEVEQIKKSVSKKDYFYQCKSYPICQYCDKEKCRARKYGLQTSGGNSHLFSNLTKYITASGGGVRWCLSFDSERCEVSTEELLCQVKLQKKILEDTNKVFRPVKQNNWIDEIETLTREGNIIIDPDDASEKGQFKEMIDMFLTNRTPKEEKRCLLSGSAYLDREAGEVYFRSADLSTFLKNKRFKFDIKQIWSWLSDMGCQSKIISIGNKSVRTWFMKMPEVYDASLDEEEKV